MTGIVTVNRELAAELLRDLAQKMLDEEVVLKSFDNAVYGILGKGRISIEWETVK